MRRDDFQAIHGARGGLLRVDVFKKPVPGTKKDHIKLTLARSGAKKADWYAFTDYEALQIARLLLWAVSERNAKIRLEMME